MQSLSKSSYAEISRDTKDLSTPYAPRHLFSDDITVVARRCGIYRSLDGFVNAVASRKICYLISEFRDEITVIPKESLSALKRLYSGDIKQFMEVHLENHICTHSVNLCREYGPRIELALTEIRLGNELIYELYSECVDVGLVLELILGDIVKFVVVEYGYRGRIKYSRALIPLALYLSLKWLEQLTPNVNRSTKLTRLGVALEEVLERARSEVLIAVPCISRELQDVLIPSIRRLAEKGIRTYLVTRPLSEADLICSHSITKYAVMYLELASIIEEMGMHVCTSSIVDTTIVVDRRHVVTSSTTMFHRDAEAVEITDSDYAEQLAINLLRSCICCRCLVKEDRWS